MNKEAIELLIQKRPRLKRSREKLEAMQPGAYCVHRSWGLGQIRDYDERENRLIIDFRNRDEGHAMDPVFCVDKLDILDDNSILVRALTEEEKVQDMIKNRPADLIADILSSAPQQAMSALEIETVLSRLMGGGEIQEVVDANQEGPCQGSPHRGAGEKNRGFCPARRARPRGAGSAGGIL